MMEHNGKSNYSQFFPKKYPMPICPKIMQLGITLFNFFLFTLIIGMEYMK